MDPNLLAFARRLEERLVFTPGPTEVSPPNEPLHPVTSSSSCNPIPMCRPSHSPKALQPAFCTCPEAR